MNILAAFRRWYWQDLPDAAQAKMLREVRTRASAEIFYKRIAITSRDFARQMGVKFDDCFGPGKYSESFQKREPLFNPAQGRWT